MERKTVRGAMKAALKESGIRQLDLAEKLNVNQSSISSNMNRPKVGSDVLVTMMNAMGYSVVAGKNTDGGFEPKWELVAEVEED